jgi:hypothetical protein
VQALRSLLWRPNDPDVEQVSHRSALGGHR